MKLESVSKEKYEGDYENAVLEQWKTCVDMANNNTEKRSSANSIFITINAALLAIISFSLELKSIILAIVGIALCILWIRTIKSYRILSKVKFNIVNQIEEKLPLKPYSYEWFKLKKKRDYSQLTSIETIVPGVFIGLFLFSILFPVMMYIKNILFGG